MADETRDPLSRSLRTEWIRDRARARFCFVAAHAEQCGPTTVRFAARRLARAERVFSSVRHGECHDE